MSAIAFPVVQASSSRLRTVFLVACLLPSCVLFYYHRNSVFGNALLTVLLVGVVSFVFTYNLIPPIADLNLRADLYGIDINKKGLRDTDDKNPAKIPEAVGIVPATVYLISITVCQLIYCQNSKQVAGLFVNNVIFSIVPETKKLNFAFVSFHCLNIIYLPF